MIHLVWSGFGFLVFVFTFGLSLASNLIANSVTGSEAYWNVHKWPLAVSLFLSAALCWFVGRFFRKHKAQVLIDPKTGREVVVRKSHTFFFIPMMWWGPLLLVFGVIAFVIEFVK
jgi:uncharacterized membrane protein